MNSLYVLPEYLLENLLSRLDCANCPNRKVWTSEKAFEIESLQDPVLVHDVCVALRHGHVPFCLGWPWAGQQLDSEGDRTARCGWLCDQVWKAQAVSFLPVWFSNEFLVMNIPAPSNRLLVEGCWTLSQLVTCRVGSW